MNWVRIDSRNLVIETTDIDPAGRYHPSLEWLPCEDGAKAGDAFKDGAVYPRPDFGDTFDNATGTWEIDAAAKAAWEEQQRREAERNAAIESLPELNAGLAVVARVAVADAPGVPDKGLLTVFAALPDAFEVWKVGTAYAVGKRVQHEGVLYEVKTAVTAQEHQPPGSDGMLAVYRPVDGAAGSEDDPKAFVIGMDAIAGLFYTYQGALWKCLRDLIPTFEGRQPGAPGMETFWQKIRDI